MERKLTDLSANPFEDYIVFEPREAEPGIAGLNELPFRRLLDQFALLEAEPPPRSRPLRLRAQLVTSAEPGYGKSHLIGRLFAALEGRAMPVYLRPFQDARSSWRSVLLQLTRELQRSGAGPVSPAPDAPTLLDFLAAGVFAGLMLRLIERGKMNGLTGGYWAEELRRDPLKTLGFDAADAGTDLGAWLRGQVADGPVLPAFESELGRAGMTLNAPAGAWLRVLLAYGAGRKHGPERAAALQWMRDEGAADEEAELIGLRPGEAGAGDRSAAGRNEDAWKRVQDFCALAGYCRPFLFCFDQTEQFTLDPSLAAEFGAMAENLVNHGLNHLTVVTTNLAPWRDNILPHIQTALRARFSAPLELEGINAEQARALARRRLEACGIGAGEISKFFEPPWFENYFKESPTESVRRFLERCAKRCEQLGGGSPLRPPPTMEEYFQRGRKGFENKGAALVFDPDVLQWAVGPEAVGGALQGGVIVERFDDPAGIARVRWRRPLPEPERQILFGFENDSRWQHWKKTLERIAAQIPEQEARGLRMRYVFLRTPEQKELPSKTWLAVGRQFEEMVKSGALTVLTVDLAQLATLHAAHELFTHVLDGNTPFGREEMLAFARGKLSGWWESLTQRPAVRAAPYAFGPAHAPGAGA